MTDSLHSREPATPRDLGPSMVWLEHKEDPERWDRVVMYTSGAIRCVREGGCDRWYSPLAWNTVEENIPERYAQEETETLQDRRESRGVADT